SETPTPPKPRAKPANQERTATMAEQSEEILLDVRVAEASRLYKFYLNQEKKILGTAAVIFFLAIWELVGNVWQLINPMFMSAPSLIAKAAIQMFGSGEIYTDLYISGIELVWGYLLSAVVAVPFGIARGPSPSGYHLVGHRHPFQDRHHLSWRGFPDLDQHARWREDHARQSAYRGQKLRRF